jgi:Cache domain
MKGVPMHRREFITLLGGAGACSTSWPRAARAQQNDRVRALQIRILRLQAEAAADKIAEFIIGIESQIGWTVQLPWSAGTIDQRKYDGVRLLRQVAAITELAQLDASGIEQLKVSRPTMRFHWRLVLSKQDYSQDPKFTEAVAKKVYYGPIYFREYGPVNASVSAPYMALSLAGTRRDAGVSVAEVNLKLIQDVVRATKVGDGGVAYVVDTQGRVIAHPDISLVQRDFSSLAQVQVARAAGSSAAMEPVQVARGINGREVLTTYAAVSPLGWLVFVELPAEEANAPAQ